jgi:hypothetical protein
MADAIRKDASETTPVLVKEKAFPGGPDPKEQGKSAHAEKVTDISDKYEEDREATLQAQMAVDPDLAAVQARAQAFQDAANGTTDGTQSVEPMHVEAESEAAPVNGQEAAPIANEHIVMQDGQQMMRLNVGGQIQLVPLARAVAELQKGVAGNARLQEAAQVRQQLEAREQALQANEASYASRISAVSQQATAKFNKSGTDADTQAFVNALFEGEDGEAATKLSGILERMSSTQATPQGMGPDQVSRIVYQALDAERLRTESQALLGKFAEDFPDLAHEKTLFDRTDEFCDEVIAEHPDWSKGQVMQEAGTRTRRWVRYKAGVEMTPTPQAYPPPLPSLSSSRQNDKETLVPMPPPRTGVQPPADEEVPQSREEILAEIRAQRNL